MKTIHVIMEAGAEGTLHLPLPEELRHGKVQVTATLRAATASTTPIVAAADKIARRKLALRELRKLGGFRAVITEPDKWQNELRGDRPLPGRE